MEEVCRSSCYLEISRADLRANAAAVAEYVGVPVIGVVKCDGYGVSGPEAAAAWVSAGVTTLAVSDPAEAFSLRRAGFADEDILLLAPVGDGALCDALIAEGVILTVSGPDCARFYAARAKEDSVRVHVAVDTGMGRFGCRWTDIDGLLEIYRTPGLAFEGIFSHFAASFEAGNTRTAQQLRRFTQVTDALAAQGIAVGTRHIANSCAALRFPETRLDAVRVGSAFLGRLPFQDRWGFERVGSLSASVREVRSLAAGATVGYGAHYIARRKTRIAVVGAGYSHGFGVERTSRSGGGLRAALRVLRLGRREPELLAVSGARRFPVLGSVGMCDTVLDVTGAEIRVGDRVELPVNPMFVSPEVQRCYI